LSSGHRPTAYHPRPRRTKPANTIRRPSRGDPHRMPQKPPPWPRFRP
jgi:hypothetical protein